MIDTTKIADVLTKIRLFGSPIILAPLLVFGVWIPALVVAVLLILTDALDGIAARKYTPHRTREDIERGGKADENADGMLTNVLLIGVAANYVLFQNDFTWSLLLKTAVVLGALGAVTVVLMLATKVLPMPWCKWADILNALYYGFLLLGATMAILGNAFGWEPLPRAVYSALLFLVVMGFCWFKRDRLFGRDDSKYVRNGARVA